MRAIKKYLIIGAISVFISVVGLLYYYYHQTQKYKAETKEKTTIIESKERVFKNSLGQYANEVDVWKVNYRDLEKAARLNNIEKSDIQKKYSEAYKIIEEYKLREKSLKNYVAFLLQAKDTIYQPMPADCQLQPIHNEFIDINFIYKDSLVGTAYNYHTGISTLISFYPKLKENGKKHWPNWGNLPWVGWDEKSITTVADPNAKIVNQISIEFKK